MSADPSVVAGPREPGWFVVTDQGVVLSVRFAERAEALIAWQAVIDGLRRELQRAGRPARFVTERVQAVQVRYGRLVGAWNGFGPLPCPVAEEAGAPGPAPA